MITRTLFPSLLAVLCLFSACTEEQSNSNSSVAEEVATTPTTASLLQPIDELLSELAGKSQFFQVSAQTPSVVIGAKGTKIYVDPTVLETKTGAPLGENISVELIEILNQSDMVLNGAQTTSNGELLVSGGSYYLNMTSNGNELQIKKGASLNVEFPQITDEEMAVFTGQKDSVGQMNWTATSQVFEAQKQQKVEIIPMETEANFDETYEFDVASKEPLPPAPKKPIEDDETVDRILSIAFEDDQMLPELQHYAQVKFRVNDDCELSPSDSDQDWFGVRIDTGKLEGEYVITFTGIGKNGEDIEKKYTVTPVLEGADYATALKAYEKKFEQYEAKKAAIEAERIAEAERQRIAEAKRLAAIEEQRLAYEKQQEEQRLASKKFQEEQESIKLTYAAVQVGEFGWINCDRFYKSTTPKTDLFFVLKDQSIRVARCYALFKDINSVMQSDYDSNFMTKGSFLKVPKGEKVTLFAVAVNGRTPLYFEREVTIGREELVELDFQPTTQQVLQDKIRALN